jgi:alpha-D-ribose 1-methylphosphonate 5-triphosphate synthase subunit PhnI
MGYFAVKGGTDAIAQAKELVEYFRVNNQTPPLDVYQIESQMRGAVDKIMGEGSLYAPLHAAIALKQVEGDVLEAAFIVRAYRATLERRYTSHTIDTRNMYLLRRISSTFKEIPGGQILGPTRDYTQRLLDPAMAHETTQSLKDFVQAFKAAHGAKTRRKVNSFSRVSDLLRAEGLLKPVEDNGSRRLVDVTREAVKFPVPRSGALQMLARAETGGVMALAYAGMRGHGSAHGTIGELRVGMVPILIRDTTARTRYIGSIKVSECEMVTKVVAKRKDAMPYLSIGYGLCFGHNETKAICMGLLDRAMRNPAEKILTQEFVLYHSEGVEAMGFTNHLKLPHYVTFQAGLKQMREALHRMQDKRHKAGFVQTPKPVAVSH